MGELGQISKSPVEFYHEQQREQVKACIQRQNPYFIEIDGVQVFTADFVHEQMTAQSRSISRANTTAFVSVVLAIMSIVTCIAALCN